MPRRPAPAPSHRIATARPLALGCLLSLHACTGGDGSSTDTGSSTGTDTGDTGTTTGTTDETPTTAPDPTAPTTTTAPDDTTSSTTDPVADSDSTSATDTDDSTTGAGTDDSTTTTGDTTSETSTSTSTSTSDTGTSDTGDTDTTTGDPDDACATPDLEHAPPVTPVGDLTAVPIDILKLDAVVTLDAATKQTLATATLQFRLGPDAGDPVFDLRQAIIGAELDGVAIAPALMAAHDLGGGPDSAMRILDADLAACSEHTLVLTYAVHKPSSPQSKDIAWEGQTTRVKWDFWFSDLWAARYLEMWFPANPIHDRFPFTLDLTLANSQFPHVVASNGAVEQLAPAQWKISYPPHFTALSPLLVLAAADRVQTSSVVLDLPDATQITLELWKDDAALIPLPEFQALLAPRFAEFVLSTGGYAHGDRFVAWAWDDPGRSMEYDGATTTIPAAADHELFHSWWGRGIKPARQSDGWIDEAWTMHAVTVGFNEFPTDFMADPVVLSSPSPWNRVTPETAYDVGEQVFAGIGALVGTDALQAAMKSFYAEHVLDLVTTEQLERHLVCTLGEPAVRPSFHRFVYGLPGDPPPLPADYCD